MPLDKLPIAVLISGTGSNLQALIDTPSDSYTITVVAADRTDASGLARAAMAGIPTVVIDWKSSENRDDFTKAVCDAAEQHGAKAMVLAGFMRILTSQAMQRFPGAIINVHPALLPSFPGAHAVEQALDYGVTQTGVTVHFVDEQVDHGPIITQRPVPVHVGDDAETLHARIQDVEHELLPEVVDAFARGDLRVDGRHVAWRVATSSRGVR
jgi:phosphoribosylglycinamide formyltransferase-1